MEIYKKCIVKKEKNKINYIDFEKNKICLWVKNNQK